MTLGTATALLRERLAALEETLRQLALSLDDVPEPDNEPAILESFREQLAEIENEVRAAIGASSDADELRALIETQQSINQAWRTIESALASYDAVDEIVRAGDERGGAWPRWTSVVREGIERCQHEIHQSADAIVILGREVVERQSSSLGRRHSHV